MRVPRALSDFVEGISSVSFLVRILNLPAAARPNLTWRFPQLLSVIAGSLALSPRGILRRRAKSCFVFFAALACSPGSDPVVVFRIPVSVFTVKEGGWAFPGMQGTPGVRCNALKMAMTLSMRAWTLLFCRFGGQSSPPALRSGMAGSFMSRDLVSARRQDMCVLFHRWARQTSRDMMQSTRL